MQKGAGQGSRTYHDYESVPKMLVGVCAMFESHLKAKNPQSRNITYDIQDLYNFVDGFGDLGVLVYAILIH